MAEKYYIDISGQVALEVSSLLRVAREIGLAREVKRSLTAVLRRLRATPEGFGEFMDHLHQLDIELRRVYVHPIAVRFAINVGARIVYLMKVEMPPS